MKKCLLSLWFPLVIVGAACQIQKSENPLSPSVAGPIPGVEISAPRPLEPTSGAQIPGDRQPVTLLIENAGSNGVRPLKYLFEVATDATFTNKVFTRDSVEPGTGGRTSFRLPDALTPGRSYYWRTKAQDGANTGPYSGAANFNLFVPVGFDRPNLIAPANNDRIADTAPEFRLGNAPRVGDPVSVTYTIELATSDTFASPFAAWQFSEQPGETRFRAPSGLPPGQQLFWRARASEGGTVGPWANAAVFRTPAPVVVPPPTSPPPGGGSCSSASSHLGVVQCQRAKYGFMPPEVLNQFLRAVARDLNTGGFASGPFGILVKTSGNQCLGYSCDIICAASSNLWDVLIDSDTTQTPVWAEKGTSSSACHIQR